MTKPQREAARRRAVQAAMLGYRNRSRVSYTQSSQRWSGIDRKRKSKEGEFPHTADCSSYTTWCLWNALHVAYRKPDRVNGQGWKAGYTGTQIGHGVRIGPSKMLAGDLVFYAARGTTPTHVAICVGKKNGRSMVISHGSQAGPLYLPWNYRRVVQCRRYIREGI